MEKLKLHYKILFFCVRNKIVKKKEIKSFYTKKKFSKCARGRNIYKLSSFGIEQQFVTGKLEFLTFRLRQECIYSSC